MTFHKTIAVMFIAGLLLVGNTAIAYSPFASEVVSSTGLSATSLYNDPAAVLGKPTTKFNSGTATTVDIHRTKLVEAAWNKGIDGEKIITTLNLNQSLTVSFDHRVMDDPCNPYGLDFIVFGNSFFTGSGASESTNLNEYILGNLAAEKVKVSVSQDNINWYRYENGPYADGLFPTNGYHWDRSAAAWTEQEMDFTKPVDPAITASMLTGMTAADALDLYGGSAGGTGFDLSESGYSWIQYIRVEGLTGFTGGEIDAFADVASINPTAVPEPSSVLVISSGLISLVGYVKRRRRSICR